MCCGASEGVAHAVVGRANAVNQREPSRLVVSEEAAGFRADLFLAREFPFLSRTRIRQKIQMGGE
jgi:hypothetical protein